MTCVMTASELLEAAIDRAGSQGKLGKAIGVTQNAIWAAKRAGRVTPEMAKAIDDWSEGEFPRWKFRPDLWEEPAHQGAAA